MLPKKEVERVYSELESRIPTIEFDSFKNKIRFYLENYTSKIEKIYKIKIENGNNGKVKFISLYYTPTRYRRIFVEDGKVFNITHFEELPNGSIKSLYGIQDKSVFNINKCGR